LEKLKDNLALYTNRAQAYIKLEKYTEAIDDCEWAFRVTNSDKYKILLNFVNLGR
jgi:hypothetical protein